VSLVDLIETRFLLFDSFFIFFFLCCNLLLHLFDLGLLFFLLRLVLNRNFLRVSFCHSCVVVGQIVAVLRRVNIDVVMMRPNEDTISMLQRPRLQEEIAVDLDFVDFWRIIWIDGAHILCVFKYAVSRQDSSSTQRKVGRTLRVLLSNDVLTLSECNLDATRHGRISVNVSDLRCRLEAFSFYSSFLGFFGLCGKFLFILGLFGFKFCSLFLYFFFLLV